jgi:hypothetical protein
MNDIKDGGPAFPLEDGVHRGMTLRDYFAAKAMQSFAVLSDGYTSNGGQCLAMAIDAYKWADAMIKVREAKW